MPKEKPLRLYASAAHEMPKKRGRKPVGQVVHARMGRRPGHGAIMENWTEDEVARLMEGIKRYRIDDYEKIQKLVPTRTVRQVGEYIKMVKMTVVSDKNRALAAERNRALAGERNRNQKSFSKGREAPIESWLDLAQEIVSYESEDHSKIYETMMAMIWRYEDLPEPTPECNLDYRKIYRYLQALLADAELPSLNQLESAVMLGLLEELLKELRQLDLTLPRKLLLWKYGLLNTKVDPSHLSEAITHSRLAFNNDYSNIVPIPDPPKEMSVVEERVGETSQGNGRPANASSRLLSTATMGRISKDPLRSVEVQLRGRRSPKKAAWTGSKTKASAMGEQPSCSEANGQGGDDGGANDDDDGACEVYHWPNSESELHLVYNPLMLTTSAEPCSCPKPHRLLPSREEDWPLFFLQSELEELQTLTRVKSQPKPSHSRQSQTEQSQTGESQPGQSKSRQSHYKQSQAGQSEPGQSQPGQLQSRQSYSRQSLERPSHQAVSHQERPSHQAVSHQVQPHQGQSQQVQSHRRQSGQGKSTMSRQSKPGLSEDIQSEGGQLGSEQSVSGQSLLRQSGSSPKDQLRSDVSRPEQSHFGHSEPGQSGIRQSTWLNPEQSAPNQVEDESGLGIQASSEAFTGMTVDQGNVSGRRRKGPGRPATQDHYRTMKKPDLLTLNPFCIPTNMVMLKKRKPGVRKGRNK